LQILSIVFFTAIGVQLLYLVLFLIALDRQRTIKKSEEVPVSVVVCAHDEEQNLKELVPVLLDQDHPRFEVIVVNDRSNDGTYDFLLEETKKDPRLRMVNVDRVPPHVNGKKFGITLGIRAASFEWILLTDADCRPVGRQWITGMSTQFDDQAQIVIGYSPYQKLRGFLNLFIRFESLVTAVQYFAYSLLHNPYMGVGRNLAYRKSLFLEKKGFNEFLHVTGGDDDLFVNQHADAGNTRLQFNPETHIYSIPKLNWASFFHQKVRHLAVGKRYRMKHRILLGVFALTWIVTWFTGLPLLVLGLPYGWIFAAALLVRVFLLMMVVRTMVTQTRIAFEWWAVPALDFLYSIYYISTGVVALLTKKIQWRN
jgi:glycosyltransferase involved in cell wall biosynthesis